MKQHFATAKNSLKHCQNIFTQSLNRVNWKFEFKIRKHSLESIFELEKEEEKQIAQKQQQQLQQQLNSPFHHCDCQASIVTNHHHHHYCRPQSPLKLDFLSTRKLSTFAIIFKFQQQQSAGARQRKAPAGLLEKLFILSFFAFTSVLLSPLPEMSSIPFAAFSAKSVHQVVKLHMQQETNKHSSSMETGSSLELNEGATKPKLGEMPHNYNFKFMKSIWGMYNQFAPQAFQKNEELTM